MIRKPSTLLIILFLTQAFLLRGAGTSITVLSTGKKTVEPGTAFNLMVNIHNPSQDTKKLSLQLILPDEGWKQLMGTGVIESEGKSNDSKIVSIFVPQSAHAGDFSVSLKLMDVEKEQCLDSFNLVVKIPPKYKIEVEKLFVPGYLFSGDSVRANFLIRNLSNTKVKVNCIIQNGFEKLIQTLDIPMDSFYITGTTMITPNKLEYYTQQFVSLSALIPDRNETQRYSSYQFDVIPTVNQVFDAFNRYPVSISTIAVYTNKLANGNNFSWMYDIKGSGMLDKEKERKLVFHFRGPNRRGNPILGLSDEYNMIYSDKKWQVVLGDYNFRLSELTESSRSGRGAQIVFKNKKFQIGSFYSISRFFPDTKNTQAVFTSFAFSPNFQLNGSYLGKTDRQNRRADLVSLSGKLNFKTKIATDFEISAGQKDLYNGMAVKGSLKLNFFPVFAYINYLQADKFFPGFVSDAEVISSGLNTLIGKRININLNFNQNRSNLALDTMYANAPNSKSTGLSINYRYWKMSSLNISLNSNSMEDKAVKKLFHYEKNYAKLVMQNSFSGFNISFQGEYGYIINHLKPADNFNPSYQSGNLTLKEEFSNKLSIGGFINYQGNKLQSVTGTNKFYYGGNLLYNSQKSTFISLDYQSNYEFKEYYRDRSLLSCQIHQELFRLHSVDLSINYNLVKNTLDKKEMSIQLHYTYKLNIPISRRNDIGSLSGRILEERGERVDGVLLNLNGNFTRTDKKGRFNYPALKEGDYTLAMDESGFDLNTIAVESGPYKMHIAAGRQSEFNISLTKAARINGLLKTVEEQSSGKEFLPLKTDLERLVLEVANEKEVFRVFSRPDGSFNFSDLRPGKWTLKVYTNRLPYGFSIKQDTYEIELKPDQTLETEIIVFKKNRKISFQKGF